MPRSLPPPRHQILIQIVARLSSRLSRYSPRAFKTQATVGRIIDGQTVHATVPISYPLRPGDTITIEERWF